MSQRGTSPGGQESFNSETVLKLPKDGFSVMSSGLILLGNTIWLQEAKLHH